MYINGFPSLRGLTGETYETALEEIMVQHYRESSAFLDQRERAAGKNTLNLFSLEFSAKESRYKSTIKILKPELLRREEHLSKRLLDNEDATLRERLELIQQALSDYPQLTK